MPGTSTRNVPVGGAATVNGVLYQMLWSLLQTSKATLARDPVVEGDHPTDVILILEPDGGGGDLVVRGHQRKTVEQLKARPDGGTWSLREVIESVIPDLYVAMSDDVTNVDYRFVTEGRMGQWKSVYKFFRSLLNRSCPENPLDDLDTTTELRFGRRRRKESACVADFWDEDSYTERTLYMKIVGQVRKRRVVRESESEPTTQKRLRTVLSGFQFDGGQRMDLVQEQIDSHLLAVVDHNDDVPQIRDSLTLELARQATAGGAEIVTSEFFANNGLNAIPLSDLGRFRSAVQTVSLRSLARLGYDIGEDVRLPNVRACLDDWPSTAPVLAITGESGCGKSWRAMGVCQLEQTSERISVVVRAGDTVDATLERATREIWETAAGHDELISLQQIGRRLKHVVSGVPALWLTLIIDGFIDLNQALQLIAQDWEGWGVRVVIGVSPSLGQRIERECRGRCKLTTIDDFTDGELHRYLQLVVGDSWPQMPEYVRYPLRKPLLASVYRSVVNGNVATDMWVPQSEYQIFQAFWDQIGEPIDQECLISMAKQVLEHGTESWTAGQLREISGEAVSSRRLEASGWLRRVGGSVVAGYEFSHFRLLNWACAVTLFARYSELDDSNEEIERRLKSYLWWDDADHRPQLAFATMDFLWLACRADFDPARTSRLIHFLAGDDWQKLKHLYSKILPTLGPVVLPALAEQVQVNARNGMTSALVTEAIGNIGGPEAAQIGQSLLRSDDPLTQISAPLILSRCPAHDALDELWHLHCESQRDPDRFLAHNNNGHKHFLYEDTFDALKACVIGALEWLENRIALADPDHDRVCDLAYLLSNQPFDRGREVWLRQKSILFEMMPENRRRSLAMCIDRFVDRDELDWLTNNIPVKEDMLGATSLRALARIAPAVALSHFGELDPQSLAMARGWIANELFCTARPETQHTLRSLMNDSPQFWTIAQVYDGRFHSVDGETLDLLLSKVTVDLRAWLDSPESGAANELFHQMRLLVQADTLPQLARLSGYAGSETERLLTRYVLRIGPQKGVCVNSLTRDEALGLLQRIGGEGFIEAINCLLLADTWRGRIDGIKLASRGANDQTRQLLKSITRSDEKADDKFYLEQPDSALVLAELDEWEALIQLVRRIGLKTSPDVTDLPRHGQRPDESLLAEAVTLVSQRPAEATPGDLLALGFGGRESANAIAKYIRESNPKGDNAHACTISLELLGNSNVENVPFLRTRLDDSTNNVSATNALIVNGTQEALAALADHSRDEVEGAVAINLINRLEDSTGAVEKTVNTMLSKIKSNSWELPHKLYQVVSCLKQEDAGKLIANLELQEFLRSRAFTDESSNWFTGSKAAAIRCLVLVDKHAAIVAARAALSNPDANDRDYYPSLLIELQGKGATDFLTALLGNETDEPTRNAIGIALASTMDESGVRRMLAATEEAVRLQGCFLAKYRHPTADLTTELETLLGDREDRVSRAAADGVIALSRQLEAYSLGEALMHSSDHRERWRFLDCLLELADPGDVHHKWPLHGPQIGNVLNFLQKRHALKRLKKRREERFK